MPNHPILNALPKSIAIGAGWLTVGYMIGSWAGIVSSPVEIFAQQRAEAAAMAVRAQKAEEAIKQMQNTVYILEWRMQEAQGDVAQMQATLEEMRMVLYSMERRGR